MSLPALFKWCENMFACPMQPNCAVGPPPKNSQDRLRLAVRIVTAVVITEGTVGCRQYFDMLPSSFPRECRNLLDRGLCDDGQLAAQTVELG
jgi:hypothetical protein